MLLVRDGHDLARGCLTPTEAAACAGWAETGRCLATVRAAPGRCLCSAATAYAASRASHSARKTLQPRSGCRHSSSDAPPASRSAPQASGSWPRTIAFAAGLAAGSRAGASALAASASGRAGDRGRRRRARLVVRARAPGSSAAFAPIRSRAHARPTTAPSECSRHLLVELGRSIGMREGVLARRLAARFRRPALRSASCWGG